MKKEEDTFFFFHPSSLIPHPLSLHLWGGETMLTPILLLVGLVSGSAPEDAVKKELAALQGTWTIEALQYNGQDVSGKYKMSLTIKDDMGTIGGNEQVQKEYGKIKLKLDPGSTPKCLDLVIVAGAQNETVLEAIYELKGDELKLCVKAIGKDRPGKFESPEGENIALVTFKREK
jgi:uncharacterized protein (TIGR03067 family)